MLQCDELKADDGPSNTLEQFSERDQVLQMIDTMKSCSADGFEKDYELFTDILSRYQEQPHILDPHLEELLRRLLSRIRDGSLPEEEQHAAFKYLYIVCKVRTYKVLVKFLPHELSDLEFVLELLERQDAKEFQYWETRYMLLLWMSILVMNPFHMARLDVYATHEMESVTTNHVQSKSKMERIFELCKLNSGVNDTCSSISAYLAAKYFIRSDIKDLYLERFFDWVISHHQADTVDVKFGQLAAIAAILKHGKREDLLPYVEKLLRWIVACQYKDSTDFLKYKNYIKIIQRIGLVYLKPRIAGWRYKRGTRSLASNLNQTTGSAEDGNAGNSDDAEIIGAEDNDEVIVPDAIEEVIEELLQALRSGGSDIRWSAAKGIGRVTNRLSKELADEVIGSVVDILSPLEPHEAWHGACLALAELAKRGLLLPQRLKELVPLLMQALFYDEMKGYMSVGQHIRDSACYMCWAFARAYNPEDFQPFVQQISAGLLTVAVFDREVNCRRAASAAFQESVGRLGNFPYGIEISTTTDFYSVGLRQNSYLNISDFIAQYGEYKRPLIDHLVERKVNHWDAAIRELTAKALHKLTHHNPEYISTEVMVQLFGKTDSIDVNTRHGSVLAIGEIILALRQLEQTDSNMNFLTNQSLCDLNNLISKFLARDLFRVQGIQAAVKPKLPSLLVHLLSINRHERRNNEAMLHRLHTKLQSGENKRYASMLGWQQIIDKCLVNKTAPVRESATAAFAELCQAHYTNPGRHTANAAIIKSYLKGADNDLEEHIRMGYISALGVLPRLMVGPHLDAVLESLVRHSLTPLQAVICGTPEVQPGHENIITYKWSEARRDSVRALCNLVQTVGYNANDAVSFTQPNKFNKVVECLLSAMDEYTLDNRGDIGAWVREAAMNAFYQLLTTCPRHMLQPDHVHKILLGFVQQSTEKIDRTRGLAGRLFCQLIHAEPQIPHIRHHQELMQVFPKDASTVLWLFADHTFPLFCSLLELRDYSKRVLLGLSASIGQLTESLIKYSSAALFQFLRAHPSDVRRLCKEIIENFEDNILNERVTYPMLNFLDILIGSGTINSILLDEESSIADDVYRLLNLEVKGHKKLYKLISSINVYCQLVQVPRLCKKILSKLSVFLGLTHVHVRKTTATKLYEALALHGDACGIEEEALDEILNLLSETDWGLPLLDVRPIRNHLCGLMDIKPPISGGPSSTTSFAPCVPSFN